MSEDFDSALVMFTGPSASLPALHTSWPAVPIFMQPLSSMTSPGCTTPLLMAASAVIGLNVDPVGYEPPIARLNSGAPPLSPNRRSAVACEKGLDRIDGLTVG